MKSPGTIYMRNSKPYQNPAIQIFPSVTNIPNFRNPYTFITEINLNFTCFIMYRANKYFQYWIFNAHGLNITNSIHYRAGERKKRLEWYLNSARLWANMEWKMSFSIFCEKTPLRTQCLIDLLEIACADEVIYEFRYIKKNYAVRAKRVFYKLYRGFFRDYSC